MCSRVAGGDEPPSVLSDNLHNLILRMKAPAFQAGLFAVPVLPTDTPILQVAHELDVRLGWSPVVSSSLSRRWSRCHRTVTRCPHLGLRHRDWTGVFGDQRRTYRRGWAPAPQNAHPWRPGRPASAGLPPLCSSPRTSSDYFRQTGAGRSSAECSSCRSGRATGADGASRRCRARSSTSARGG
jgi:hypothetical protein